MNILVIDDCKEDRELAITYIKKSNNNSSLPVIDESNCLTDALNKINLNNYDVIILDLALPESDGIDTVKKVINKLTELNKNGKNQFRRRRRKCGDQGGIPCIQGFRSIKG